MLEKFQFFSLLMANYLVLGTLLAALTRGLLYLLSVNAATRHSVWMGALVLLILLPVQGFVAPNTQLDVFEFGLDSSSGESLEDIGLTTTGITDTLQLETAVVEQPESESTLNSDTQFNHWLVAAWQFSLSYLPESSLLYWVGLLLVPLLLAGTVFRFVGLISAYKSLRILLATSKPVVGEISSRLIQLSKNFELRQVPTIKHSDLVTTPLATGVFRPVVLMPSSLLQAGVSSTLLDQVLLHELAHIKRRDTLIVVFQAAVSLVLYWHPAFRYIDRKINFERELACDDWVVSYERKHRFNPAKTYANTLVELSELLSNSPPNLDSLVCPQSTNGLKSRVRILLNPSLDHSTISSRKPYLLMLPMMMALAIAWGPLWPQYPHSISMITETEQANSGDSSIGLIQIAAVTSEPTESGTKSDNEEQAGTINTISEEVTIKPVTLLQQTSSSAAEVEPLQKQITRLDSDSFSAISLEPLSLISQTEHQAMKEVQEPYLLEADQPQPNLHSTNRTANTVVSNDSETYSELSLSISETGELNIQTPTTVEEIRVTARRSLYSLRSQIRRAEKALYSTYNEYNVIDEFRVHCRKKELYEDLRRSYRCWPQFFEDQVAAEAQSLLNDTGLGIRVVDGGPIENYFGVTAISTLKARNRSQFEGLKNNILLIAMEQSEVYDSLSELAQLELAYQLRREECLAKPPVLFLLRRCS